MHYRRPSPRGFALIIAITLMAFIFLLLMSLSTLTQTELSSATSTRSSEKSKMNARLGLMVALGRLQTLAGPDQRTTANAALLDKNATTSRYWTGVWDSASWNPQTPANHRFLGWLVSGSSDVVDTRNGYNASKIDMIYIVGNNELLPENSVRVPLVEINEGNGINGGKYAFWVSDESLKAKVNLDDPYQRASQTELAAEKARVFLPRMNAIDLDERFAEDIDLYSNNWGKWQRIYSLDALDLMDANFAPLLQSGDAYAETFHNYTTEGYGLLTDAQRGGLRKNLTAGLRDNTIFDAQLAGKRLLEMNEITASFNNGNKDFFTPRWEMLRDYALLPNNIPELRNLNATVDERYGALLTTTAQSYYRSNPDGLAKVAALLKPGQTASQELLSNDVEPLIARFGLYSRLVAEYVGSSGPGSGEYNIYLDIYPRVTLWNPYSVSLRLSGDYTIEADFQPLFIVQRLENAPDGPSTVLLNGRLRGMSGANRETIALRLFADELAPEDRVLAPGEFRVFGLQDISDMKSEGKAGQQRMTVNMAPYHSQDGAIRYTVTTVGNGKPVNASDYLRITWQTFSEYTPASRVKSAQIAFIKKGASDDYTIQNIDNFYLDNLSSSFVEIVEVGLPPSGGAGNNNLAAHPMELGGYDLHLKTVAESTDAGIPVLAAFNPRAYYNSLLTHDYYNGKPANWSVNTIDTTPLYQDYDTTPNGLLLRGRWGTSSGSTGQRNVVIYDLPRTFPLSLSEFRHANLSSFAHLPAHPIGNSWANPYLDPRYVVGTSGGLTQMDLPWMLNTAIWDKYFLSALPENATGTLTSLPNNRLITIDAATTAEQIATFDEAASHLVINGAFNVNSTSVQAWSALLGSLNASAVAAYNPVSGSSDTLELKRAVSRFGRPLTGANSNDPEWFQGHWNLSDDQIRSLAEAIVNEVRERGPFLNLADFVNRRLVSTATGKSGALQAAIDATASINNTFISTYNLQNAEADFDFPNNAPAQQAAGMTGYMTQADLLTTIGPVITTRGDTFRIVVYGQAPDDTGGQEGPGIYLQAIVQRIPAYMQPEADEAHTPTDELTSAVNKEFGRQFRIVSFEWLQKAPL